MFEDQKDQKISESSKNNFNKLKEISEGILSILKLISLIMSAFSIIIGFVFAITYMRDNGFFSYGIFSINFMWIFLLMGIFFVAIHGFYIIGAYLRITQISENHQRTKKQRSAIYSYIVCIVINIFLIVSIFFAYCYRMYNNVIFICFIIICFGVLLAILFFIALISRFCKEDLALKDIALFPGIIYVTILIILCFRGSQEVDSSFIVFAILFFLFEALIIFVSYDPINIERFFVALSIIFIAFHILFLLLSVPSISQFLKKPQYFSFNFICKKFLESINLASDHVEIYLKDKNGSIPGKLIFDDGKYAYVEFDRTYSNCIDIGGSCIKTIRRKVPSEDVSIVVSPKKQQDKQPETKYQEVE